MLVVDDDANLLRLLATTFRATSLRVLQARTAAAGLRMAREERPALLFLDVRLGGEDGLRVCRALKSDPRTRSIRVFVLSAADDAQTRDRAHQAGADGFFAKPFSPLALWQTVDEMLVS
ncbi:MAG TPA: response regulator [Chloroflexota bacterium]|nr:response regulator [Chloroflexota bacterium]